MPTLSEIATDPAFAQLPEDARVRIARDVDPDFAKIPQERQAPVLADFLSAHAQGTPSAAPAPAPAAAPAAPASTIEGVHNPLKVGAYRLASIAADYNALMHHWGFGTDPKAFKDWMGELGVPGAESLPDTEPQTPMQQISAYFGPMTVPTRMVGAGVLAQSATGHVRAGDVAEMLMGGLETIKQAVGIGRYITKNVRDFRAARAGQMTTEQVFEALRTAKDEAAKAQLAESVAATSRREAGWAALKASPSTIPTPEEEFANLTGLAAGTPSGMEVGKEIIATGRQRTQLVPGENVGAKSIASRVRDQSQRIFRHAEEAATGMEYERGSAGLLKVQSLTKDLQDRITGSRPEDVLASRAGAEMPEPPRRLMGRGLSADESRLIHKLRYAGGEVDPQTGDIVERAGEVQDVKGLMQLYAEARHAALQPDLYPTLTSDAKNAFFKITNALGNVVRTEVQDNERAAGLWDAATQHVLEVRAPVEKSMRFVGKARTTTQALKRGLFGDPEDAFNLFRHAGPRWAMRLRQGGFAELLRRSKGNANKLAELWDKVPQETKYMMAAPATPRSTTALSTILAKGKPITQAKMNVPAIFREIGPDLQVGVDRITQAIKDMQVNQHTLRAATNTNVFARYHLVRGAMSGLVGSPSAVYQLSTYALMTRPGLVSALFTLPPQSVRWQQAAAALNAVLEPIAHRQQLRQQMAQ